METMTAREVHVPSLSLERLSRRDRAARHWRAASKRACGAPPSCSTGARSGTSTRPPAGGGVAEMLRSWVGLARGLGIDMRWLTIAGTPEFFALTKRLHN